MKVHRIGKRLRTYQKSSLLTRLFFTLITFCLLLIFILGGFFLYSENENLENNYNSTNERLLRQTSQSLQLILKEEATKLYSLLYNKEVIRGVIAHSIIRYEDITTLSSQLSYMVDTQSLIQYICYYLVKPGIFYDSNQENASLSQCPISDVIQEYLNDPSRSTRIEMDGNFTDILVSDGFLYLIQSYPGVQYSSYAYLIFQIPLDTLYHSIQANQSDFDFILYDQRNQPIFHGDGNKLPEELLAEASGSSKNFGLLSDQTAFYYRDNLGWLYFYANSLPSDSHFLFQAITPPLVIFLAIVLIAGIFVSLYTSLLVYRPISSLVELISAQSSSMPAIHAKNETDYLNQAYASMLSWQQEIAKQLPALQTYMHEKLFLHLFQGADMSPEHIERQLELIQSPLKLHDFYIVLLTKFEPTDQKDLVEVRLELARLRMMQRINSFIEDQAIPIYLCQKDALLITVFSFSEKYHITQIQVLLERMRDQLKVPAEEDGIRKIIGYGDCYPNLLSLRQAFLSAEDNLQINQYYQCTPEDTSNMLSSELSSEALFKATDRHSAYFISEAKKIMAEIEQEEISHTYQATSKLIEDISLYYHDLERALPLFQFLICLYQEQLLHLIPHIENEYKRLPNKHDLQGLASVQEAAACTDHACQQFLQLLDNHYRSNHYRHVDQAKKYVAANYKDPNLSLETAADFLGIHPSFLSRTFKSYAGCNFWEYVNKYRVEKAIELLDHTDLAIQEIGFVIGFSSISTFFRVFKKYTGYPPGQYRQKREEQKKTGGTKKLP